MIGSRSNQPMFHVTLLVVSFCVWLLSWTFLRTSSFAWAGGWGSQYLWTGWLGGLILAAARFHRSYPEEFPFVALALPMFILVSGDWRALMLVRTGQYPSVDEMVLVFDKIYGYPEFVLGRLVYSTPFLLGLAKSFYAMLVLPVIVIYIALKDGHLRRRMCVAFGLMGVCGVVFYQFCPAAGPLYVFPAYPAFVPAVDPAAKLLPNLILNATPSVHLAISMLVVLYSRYCSRPIQVFAGICLLFTVFVTLGLGEHYVIDLVLGVPFAVAIDCVSDRNQRRKAYACFLLVLVWEIALCHGFALQIPAPIALLLSVVTLAAPFVSSLNWNAIFGYERKPGKTAPFPLSSRT